MMFLRMFPTFAKRLCTCGYCEEKNLFRDSPVIAIFWRIGSFPVKKYYHPECGISAMETFINEYFEEHDAPSINKPLGRPQKSPNPIEYRKLKALQRYHKKQGHGERVKELEVEIQVLLKVTQRKVEPESVQIEEREEPLSKEEEALAQVQQTWEGGEKAFPRPGEEEIQSLTIGGQ